MPQLEPLVKLGNKFSRKRATAFPAQVKAAGWATENLSRKAGWFVSVGRRLDPLRSRNGEHHIEASQSARVEPPGLLRKLRGRPCTRLRVLDVPGHVAMWRVRNNTPLTQSGRPRAGKM